MHGTTICPHIIATLLVYFQRQHLESPYPSPIMSQEFPDEVEWKDRNDRQLRLWGLHGQQRISKTNVLLLNASVVGSETLKNIVLPGFGRFTIVDDRLVTPQDLGKNFFATMDSIGSPIAKIVCESLAELNPDDVSGQYLVESPKKLIQEYEDFFDKFNFVIASNLDADILLKLSKICWAKNINLMVCRSYGMIGYIRMIVKSHEIVEGKLDQTIDDLFITNPWPDLLKYSKSVDLESLPFKKHSHVPYIIILIHFLQKFQQVYNKRYPETQEEQEVFDSWLRQEEMKALERRSSEIIDQSDEFANLLLTSPNEENFADAYKFIFQAWTPNEIPPQILEILKHKKLSSLSSGSSDFWFLCSALKRFIDAHGVLPVSGKIPDMTSDTESYVTLQTIYRKRSRDDMTSIKKFVNDALASKGRKTGSILDYDIKEFCTNISYIRYFEYKSLEDELNPKLVNVDMIRSELENPDSSIVWYIMLRSVDLFHLECGYYPGANDDVDMKHDAKILQEIATNFIKSLGVEDHVFDFHEYAMEMTRFGASEIHNVSSLIGGVSAQELIKLCTRQRVPLVNTWVFDGIRGVASVFDV
jgi:amyloid beta precursor protein binding protein 1